MLYLRNVIPDIPATMGINYVLVAMRDRYKYNGAVKTDITDGVFIDVVLVDRGYQRVSVIVPSEGVHIDEVDIAANTKVRFDGLTIKVYVIDGRPRVSVRADSVTAIRDKKATA